MTSATSPSRRDQARTRAGNLLGIPHADVEDDLIDFLVAEDGDVLLRARAGSGKTTALAIKVAYLVFDRGVEPSSIMLLTFNNAAARSLEARLAAFAVPTEVRVRTFHAFGQRVVRAHFGKARTPVFDEKSEEGQQLSDLMSESLDEVISEKFYFFAAGRMRTRYDKRRDYVESIGRDALVSCVGFLRTHGFGMQNTFPNAWDVAGPIGGTAMKVTLAYERRLKEARLLDGPGVLQAASWTLEREIETGNTRQSDAHGVDWVFVDEF